MYDADLFCVLVRDSGQFHPLHFSRMLLLALATRFLEWWEVEANKRRGRYTTQQRQLAMTTVIDFSATALIPPGARGGQASIFVTARGHVAVVAIGSSVFAVPGLEVDLKHMKEALTVRSSGKADASRLPPGTKAPECAKILSFGQSSQIHPVIIVDIQDRTMDPDWYSLLLANGRECAVVDIQYDSHNNSVSAGSPRNGTVTLASPILAAASSWPFLTLLTSDGLVSLRRPSCLAIALKTVESRDMTK